MDSQGYFLLDVNSKPAKPLTQGLPITFETGEKEIDLSDNKGMFQFNGAKKEVQTKEMPVTILVPNPRSMYSQQLSFASIAKTIMIMCTMGRRKQKVPLSNQEDMLDTHLANLTYLQEVDFKVQKEQCLYQLKEPIQSLVPNAKAFDSQGYNTQYPDSGKESNQSILRNITTQN